MTKFDTTVYARLTAPERIQVTLEALARSDLADVERLVRSCPRFTYTTPDALFLAGCESASALAEVAYFALTGDLDKLALIEAVNPLITRLSVSRTDAFDCGYYAALLDRGADDNGSDNVPDHHKWLNSDRRLLAEMEAIRVSLAATITASYQAFDRAAREHYGVGVLTAIGAANPDAAARLSAELAPLRAVAPDARRLAEMAELLAKVLPPVRPTE